MLGHHLRRRRTGEGSSEPARSSDRDFFRCSVCRSDIESFAPGPNQRPGARCPKCNALERHRFLAIVLDLLSQPLHTARTVVEFSPHGSTRSLVETRANRYLRLDLVTDSRPSVAADITALPFADRSIDFMICYHVLEHVPDDATAMRELARTLRPIGVALIQVPMRASGPTVEDPMTPPEERARRFGREDHVRRYGDDFSIRLAEAGILPTLIQPRHILRPDTIRRHGLVSDERVWICRPSTSPDR